MGMSKHLKVKGFIFTGSINCILFTFVYRLFSYPNHKILPIHPKFTWVYNFGNCHVTAFVQTYLIFRERWQVWQSIP